MLHIIQSNKVERLFEHLLAAYRHSDHKTSVFEPFNVIVPSKVMGEWLKKQVADQAGISTLVTTEFWGRYLLSLMQRVLRTYARFRDDILEVPEVAMLSKNVMQWQIFGLLMAQQEIIMADEAHPLHSFVAPLVNDKNTNHIAMSQSPLDGSDDSDDITDTAIWATNESLLFSSSLTDSATHQSLEQRFWQLSNDMASMLNRYMTYRPMWLESWGKGERVDVTQMIADKDALHNQLYGRQGDDAIMTPDWLVVHYVQLEAAQRYLWQTLFNDDYRYRETLTTQFWQAFDDDDARVAKLCRERLPKQLILFTVQQLPPSELLDLQRLGALTEVTLLHFNPSQQFWADIVDKNWLMQEHLNNPSAVLLKDYGHTLLSRFGKQSREVFAMLANLSGNAFEQITWQDDFVESIDDDAPKTLLQNIQQDILMLEERETQSKIRDMLTLVQDNAISESDSKNSLSKITWPQREHLLAQIQKIQQAGLSNAKALQRIVDELDTEYDIKRKTEAQRYWQTSQLIDSSLSIHACHSMVRQLEVLRSMLIGWLNYTDDPAAKPDNIFECRSLSDVLVLVPDLEAQQNTIESIFPKGVGADGYTLPAKVTGVVAKDINQLWQAIMGYYRLLNRAGARFNRAEVFDWLMLPPLYESFGLSLEEMSRACELLEAAGFIRGFDEAHLQQTLHVTDDDYRYSFAYALERIVAGLMMPQAQQVQFGTYINRHGHCETIMPLDGLSMEDAGIVAVLCDIFDTLNDKRDMAFQTGTVAEWLQEIESLIKDKFAIFAQTNALLAIFAAQNAVKRHIEANYKKPTQQQAAQVNSQGLTRVETDTLPFNLSFILDSLANELVSQQVSAEPAGVITFARIGAVRNLPYKLIVMLNLNLADFPQREQHNRYNLMQAGLPSRGDRFREDDDLGAFLDAILCAQEACWLFYNGKSTIDTHEHLPASPVQELLGFLQSDVNWQDDITDDQDNLTLQQVNTVENSLSKNIDFTQSLAQHIEQYLVTHHPALPFDRSYFEMIKASEDLTTSNSEGDNHFNTADKAQTENISLDDNKPTYTKDAMRQRLTLAKSRLYPAAKIWHTLYEQLNQADATQNIEEVVTLWSQTQLQDWLTAWHTQQDRLNKQLTKTAAQPVPQISYENLTQIIQAMQKTGVHFIQSQRLHLSKQASDDQTLEALVMDNLQRYYLNALLLDHVLQQTPSNASISDTAPSPAIEMAIEGTMALFDDILPAGVNRYRTLALQRQQLNQDLFAFVARLQALTQPKIDDDTASQSDDKAIDLTALKKLVNAHFGKAVIDSKTRDNSQLLSQIAGFITPCQEQRVAVDIAALDENAVITAERKRIILTASLPKLPDLPDTANNQKIKAWIHYLPTSGKEKYRLQFWLNHLCWQVARRTTPAQANKQDGFSLWQFSNQQTLYLPPLPWQTAYRYLQDWLMVWELAKLTLVILPPPTVLHYLQMLQDKPESQPNDWLSKWQTVPFGQTATTDHFDHDTWQLLIGDKRGSVILPYLKTLGKALYQPILDEFISLDKPT